ncbi:hypothetical protein [Subtercola sp. YIM 133946]|uniref:hypothetical protein n=1 Tax=Subtercola sp. YIM 133946 TaxID=3118909 RepID=UPI002F941CA7
MHSLIPTGVLCTFPAAADGTGLVLFGAAEFAGAGSVATVAFVATVLAFFLASRLRPELAVTGEGTLSTRREGQE